MKRAEVVNAVAAVLEAAGYADRVSTEVQCRIRGERFPESIGTMQLHELHNSAHAAVGGAVYGLAKALSDSGDDVSKLGDLLLRSRHAGQEKAETEVGVEVTS